MLNATSPTAVGTRFADEASTAHPRFPGNMSNSATTVVIALAALITNVSGGDEVAEQDSVQTAMHATCKGDAVERPAPDDGCDFAVVDAADWAARPQRYSQWNKPILITGAAVVASFSAPFDYGNAVRNGVYDAAVVTAGPSASAALFDGVGSTRLPLGSFREHMTQDDVLIDFNSDQPAPRTRATAAPPPPPGAAAPPQGLPDPQRSGEGVNGGAAERGRHARQLATAPALPIPGVPTGNAAEDGQWWSVISVGVKDSGFPLHEHGAAWCVAMQQMHGRPARTHAPTHPPTLRTHCIVWRCR